MSNPVRETGAMIAGMNPMLDPQVWVFCTGLAPVTQALASFAEAEGLSQVVPLAVAEGLGADVSQPMRRIVLQVNSALDGVGLTAAVAGALASEGVACNMVAAFHHDHVFVPAGQAERALVVLQALQAGLGDGA